MEKVLVFSLLVLASLRSASTEMFIREGGNVTLDLRPAPSDPITIIQWKFKDSILAEWIKAVLPLTHNRDNSKLEIVNGSLSMEKMTKEEEGVYSVEVNNNVQKVTYNVLVIKDVPKTEIKFFPLICSDESDKCNVSCEGDTTGAEPVTYSWKTGDGEWKESRRDMPITREEHGQVMTFTCKMKNPVSEKESVQVPNKLYKEEEEVKGSSTGWIVGVILLLLLLALVGLCWAWKNKKLPCWKQSTSPESAAENGKVPGDANEELLKNVFSTNTSLDAKSDSQAGPTGGPADPPNTPQEEEPVSKDEPTGGPADPPNPPQEEEPVSKDEPTGEPADPPNPPHDEKPVSKDEPTGEPADPPNTPQEEELVSKDEPTGEPADPPKHEEKSVIKDAGGEGEADTKL